MKMKFCEYNLIAQYKIFWCDLHQYQRNSSQILSTLTSKSIIDQEPYSQHFIFFVTYFYVTFEWAQ